MQFTTTPIRVAHPHDDEGGLIFTPDRLVTVLVKLSALHGRDAGKWHLEAGFGLLYGRMGWEPFDSLEEAQRWLASELEAPPRREEPIAAYAPPP